MNFKRNAVLIISVVVLFFSFCSHTSNVKEISNTDNPNPELNTPPEWAKDAIWYQIFPERFRNGDQNNDPTIETLDFTWPYDKQTEWAITPWTSDWYKLQPWEKNNNKGFYYNAQLRRYGGDLQGIIDKLDYLKELGINAIYLNPIFESPSLHKYGATMYHHVDNNFGPDPEGDIKIWEQETPDDPATWQWTSADNLFLKLIKEVHSRDMKIIIDGVFNHVGIPFWAFQDVHKNGKNSKYNDWFIIKTYDDPTTEEDEFDYQGWYGVMDLPEIYEDANGACEAFRNHIEAIVKRWGDPNNDGNPEDGLDGWRLDVAHQVSIKFWEDFNKWVKDVNPEAYITGEVWWEDFQNNKMYDATPYLGNGVFDAVMNYRFGDAMLKSFIDKKNQILPSELDKLLGEVRTTYPEENQYVLQNLLNSHDTERLASMLLNPDRYIDHGGNVSYEKEFKIHKPNQLDLIVQKAILTFQFTYPGSPFLYYGEEVGMWGADDPDCRKPMVWDEFEYEDEIQHPHGFDRPKDKVEVDSDLFLFYQSVINLRKNHESLRRGKYKTILVDDENKIFGFERWTEDEKTRMFFNLSETLQKFSKKELLAAEKDWILIFGELDSEDNINAKSGIVFKKIK